MRCYERWLCISTLLNVGMILSIVSETTRNSVTFLQIYIDKIKLIIFYLTHLPHCLIAFLHNYDIIKDYKIFL